MATTYKKNKTVRHRYIEEPLPAPVTPIHTRELVAAFCTEVIVRHDRARHMEEEAENAYREAREARNALHYAEESARMQGRDDDDPREPLAYLESELNHMRGLLLRIADNMGVSFADLGFVTSDPASTVTNAIVARWERVCAAATRHGWKGADDLPEEHLDAEVARWKARALTAEQDGEHYRPRAKAGD
jgi:hypothetical protein